MTADHPTADHTNLATDEPTSDGDDGRAERAGRPRPTASRRTILRAAGATAFALGSAASVGSGTVAAGHDGVSSPATVLVTPTDDGDHLIEWSERSNAEAYAVYVDGEDREEVDAPPVERSDVTDGATVGVASVDEDGEESEPTETTFVPIEDRTDLVEFGLFSIAPDVGDTSEVPVTIEPVPAELTGVDLTLEIEPRRDVDDWVPVASFSNVEPASEFSSVSIDEIDDGPTLSVDVSLEGGSIDAQLDPFELLEVSIDGLEPGEIVVAVRDVQLHYADRDEAVTVDSISERERVWHPRHRSLPSNLRLEQPAPRTIEATWDPVDDAASFDVYVDDEFVTSAQSNSAVLTDLDTDREREVTVEALSENDHAWADRTETFVPLEDRESPLDVRSLETYVDPGEQVAAAFRLGDVSPLLETVEFTVDVVEEPHDEADGPISTLASVEAEEEYADVDYEYVEESGSLPVQVTVEDYAHPAGNDVSAPVLSVAFDTLDAGDVHVVAEDVRLHYEHRSEPLTGDALDYSLVVDYSRVGSSPEFLTARQVAADAIEVHWTEVEDATGYEVLLDGEVVAEVEETSTVLTDVDAESERLVEVRGFNPQSTSREEETTYVPLAERDHRLQFVADDAAAEYGETVTARALFHTVEPAITGVECSMRIEAAGDDDGSAVSVDDASPSDAFDDVELDVAEDGTAVDLSLAGGTLDDEMAPLELATVELSADEVGDVELVADDGTFEYEGGEQPVAARGASFPLTVEPLGAPAPPSTVMVEERTDESVTLSWTQVRDAETYAVYATPLEPPEESLDDEDPLLPLSDDDLVLETEATSATVEGLDSLSAYQLGVTSISLHEAESAATTRAVTTAASDDVPSVHVELEEDGVEEGTETTASLHVSNAPEDLLGYVVHVRLSDPEVASLEDFEAVAPFDDFDRIRAGDRDGSWLTVEGIDAEDEFEGGDAELGTVTLEATTAGVTDVVPVVVALSPTEGEPLSGEAEAARLDVAVDNWNGTMQYREQTFTPNDANGDGLYRDVNGDGDVTAQDLQVFFANQHTDVVQNNPELFDFTGSGDVSQLDVIQLFEDL